MRVNFGFRISDFEFFADVRTLIEVGRNFARSFCGVGTCGSMENPKSEIRNPKSDEGGRGDR